MLLGVMMGMWALRAPLIVVGCASGLAAVAYVACHERRKVAPAVQTTTYSEDGLEMYMTLAK